MVGACNFCRRQNVRSILQCQKSLAGLLARKQVGVGADEAIAGRLGDEELVFRLGDEHMRDLAVAHVDE